MLKYQARLAAIVATSVGVLGQGSDGELLGVRVFLESRMSHLMAHVSCLTKA